MKWRPSSVPISAVPLAGLPVSRWPPATKSTDHGPSRLTTADSAPEVNVAARSSQQVLGSAVSPAAPGSNWNCGSRGVPPAKWMISTPMTSGMGAVKDSVTAGPVSRSPRCRMRLVGA